MVKNQLKEFQAVVCYILPFFGSDSLIHSIINSGHTAAYNHFFLIGNETGKNISEKNGQISYYISAWLH